MHRIRPGDSEGKLRLNDSAIGAALGGYAFYKDAYDIILDGHSFLSAELIVHVISKSSDGTYRVLGAGSIVLAETLESANSPTIFKINLSSAASAADLSKNKFSESNKFADFGTAGYVRLRGCFHITECRSSSRRTIDYDGTGAGSIIPPGYLKSISIKKIASPSPSSKSPTTRSHVSHTSSSRSNSPDNGNSGNLAIWTPMNQKRNEGDPNGSSFTSPAFNLLGDLTQSGVTQSGIIQSGVIEMARNRTDTVQSLYIRDKATPTPSQPHTGPQSSTSSSTKSNNSLSMNVLTWSDRLTAGRDSSNSPVLTLLKHVPELKTSKNREKAIVYIKPHACTPLTIHLVKSAILRRGIRVVKETQISGDEIESRSCFDKQYIEMSSSAFINDPADIALSARNYRSFLDMFDVSWDAAIQSGLVLNALQACAFFGVDGETLSHAWLESHNERKVIQFRKSLFCGLVDNLAGPARFVVNGFLKGMRAEYVRPGAIIHLFSLEWEWESVLEGQQGLSCTNVGTRSGTQLESSLTWTDFLDLVGDTDPSSAHSHSIRRKIYENWAGLGLECQPNILKNAVHASKSAFEAFAERAIWLSQPALEDSFALRLTALGISHEKINWWLRNPEVGGKSILERMRGLGSERCIARAQELFKKS